MNSLESITIRRLNGPAIAEQLDALASLRLDIFAEYPYLYRGQRADELTYLAAYAEKPGGCLILAEDNGTVIGAATGMPLRFEEPSLRDPVAATLWPIDRLYYVGELLLRPAYRAHGLGQRLLSEFETYIRTLDFNKIVCVTVERPADHPLRPDDAIPIDRFLARTGFFCLDGVTTHFSWMEVDGVKHDHTMQFWLKNLD